MTRKDVIIMAMLINTALLAVLFLTASPTAHEEKETHTTATQQPLYPPPEIKPSMERDSYFTYVPSPLDEVDQAIREYVPRDYAPQEGLPPAAIDASRGRGEIAMARVIDVGNPPSAPSQPVRTWNSWESYRLRH